MKTPKQDISAYREALHKLIGEQIRDIDRPGEDSVDQFIIQEEMKKASFGPKRTRDNPF